MSQLAQQHQWQLGSHAADRFADHSAGSSGIAISAVCAACGLVRVQVVASMGEQHIDLRGVCPGTPQEPGEHLRGEWPDVAALSDDPS
jgi:hypothetical protein